jgi:hypothetical protein
MSNFIAIETASLANVYGGATTKKGNGKISGNYGPASGSIEGGGEVTTNNLADCYTMGDKICTSKAQRPSNSWFGSKTTTDSQAYGDCLEKRQDACNQAFPKDQ